MKGSDIMKLIVKDFDYKGHHFTRYQCTLDGIDQNDVEDRTLEITTALQKNLDDFLENVKEF